MTGVVDTVTGSFTPLSGAIVVASAVAAVLQLGYEAWADQPVESVLRRDRRRARRRMRAAGAVARVVTAVAAAVAGRRRASDFESWLGDLVATSPGYGPLGPRDQVRYALGLLHAAVRMRAEDGVAGLGGVLDRWLRSDPRICATSAAVFAAAVTRLWVDGGFLGVVVNGQGLVALTAAPWGAALVLRRVRGVVPVRRKRADRR